MPMTTKPLLNSPLCHDALNCEHNEDQAEAFKAINSLSCSSTSTQAPCEHHGALRSLSFSSGSEAQFEFELHEFDDGDAALENEAHYHSRPTLLGSPNGSTEGFYGLMRQTRDIRRKIVQRMCSKSSACYSEEARALQGALLSLHSLPRPSEDRGNDHTHSLMTDSTSSVTVCLEYEKTELLRDVCLLDGGEAALLSVMRSRHDKKMSMSAGWLESKLPSWSESIESAMVAMRAASGAGYERGRIRCPAFRNFITDRDGTTNNYCDRYASSVQSAYNALWMANFARQCTDNTVLLTAAPLGGRLHAEGLLEVCTMPQGSIIYAGSKGREYLDSCTKQVLEVEPLPLGTQELLEELHHRLATLCKQPRNSKFLGLGSGLQYKCGELTMARNDPAGNASEAESSRFKAEVQKLVHELDPEGKALHMHDTGTDIEISLCSDNGHPSFSKSDGIIALDRKLRLGVAAGPNLVCGDTESDIPMIKAALQLMTETCGSDGPPARASKLAVVFVVSPEQAERTPNLAGEVRKLCSDKGAHCAIVPSPDVLVAALAQFTREAGDTHTPCLDIVNGHASAQ